MLIPRAEAGSILEAAQRFFALPQAAKDAVHIRRSPHFRGYSEMKNERDWREQIHFGAERLAGGNGFWRLEGPNLWPAELGEEWKRAVLEYLEAASSIGQRLLADLGLPVEEPPYLLLKMICYHPQPAAAAVKRSGVAAHCDWSWITILDQDDVGGLEEQAEDGDWHEVLPEPGKLFVNFGELAEITSGGGFCATPHRVVNRSTTKPRISIPVFINPPLDALVRSRAKCFDEWGEHVHRVRNPAERWGDFRFGESEWRRKAVGKWCWREACLSG